MADARPARGELHPLRGEREPALSRPGDRARDAARGVARGAAALLTLLLRVPRPLAAESRPVPAHAARPRAAPQLAGTGGCVHAGARPLGGRVPQPRPARPRLLHGLGRKAAALMHPLLRTSWRRPAGG